MKTIVLVRHGKSSWDYEVSDKDRPLQLRGIKDAHLISEIYSREQLNLNRAYSSPANRALHTCMIFLRIWDFPLDKLEITDSLYDFSGDSVKSFIQDLDDDLEKVVLFGHNYAFTELVNYWGDRSIENVPTSGLVEIKFDVPSWNKVSKGIINKVLFPKQLRK